MNDDDIMLMVLDAGPLTKGPFDAWCKRFAAFVAAHEREACAKLETEAGVYTKHDLAVAIRARGTHDQR